MKCPSVRANYGRECISIYCSWNSLKFVSLNILANIKQRPIIPQLWDKYLFVLKLPKFQFTTLNKKLFPKVDDKIEFIGVRYSSNINSQHNTVSVGKLELPHHHVK